MKKRLLWIPVMPSWMAMLWIASWYALSMLRARQELVDRVAEPHLIAVGELLAADARLSLTNVPFVELRSSTHQLPSSSTNSRACWRDTELRPTTKPASLSRPTMYWLLTSGMRRPISGPGGCRLTRHASPAGPSSSPAGPIGRCRISVPPSR